MMKQKLASVSPWVLAAACTLLTLIIGVFAVNNYQREKKLMTEVLLQQGMTLERFVMSSSRASLRGNLRNIHVAMWHWTDHVQQAIDSTANHPGLRFLGLVDPEGRILAGTVKDRIGTNIDDSTIAFLQSMEKNNTMNGIYRIHKNRNNDIAVFQVASLFFPVRLENIVPRTQGRDTHSRFLFEDLKTLRGKENRKWLEQLREMSSEKYALVVELDLSQFNRAVHRQLLQIIFLSLVLLLVGIGGWLSLLTLQGLKGSQIRLRHMREFTDNLISSLPVGLIATGENGTIQIYNQSAAKIIGTPGLKTLGKKPERVLPDELTRILTRKSIDSGEPAQLEISLIDQHMKSRSLLLVALPVVDSENRFSGNTLLIQDITKIRELEKMVQRNERLAALGKMAAGVAHELRNPLSSIKGLAVLLKSKLTRDQHGTDTVNILVDEVERLNRSISELLDFSRPPKLQRELIDIETIIDKATSLIRVDADGVNVAIHTHCAEKNIQIYADKDKLIQVFLNLFINSIQAMEHGGILKIDTSVAGEWVICRIEDNGCGIDRENISKVFDPYFTTKNEGTGLGLAMSAKIIEEHSGSIEFRSDLGKGTVVKISLPRQGEEI